MSSYKLLQRAKTDPAMDCPSMATYKSYAYIRKHSSGDLHSRLKTRKLLGVGETDDGEVHRSKLSQILGHSEQLYIKLPRGLRAWQCFTTTVFGVLAVWAFMFPVHFYSQLTALSDSKSISVLPLRLYAVAMLSFAVFSYANFRSNDRDAIRISMFSGIVYFSLHSIVIYLESAKGLSNFSAILLACNILVIFSGYYIHTKLGQAYQPSSTSSSSTIVNTSSQITTASFTSKKESESSKKHQ